MILLGKHYGTTTYMGIVTTFVGIVTTFVGIITTSVGIAKRLAERMER